MKRRGLTIGLVLVLVIAASGCSWREVQLWFQVVKHSSISADQARSVADAVNLQRPEGCDSRFQAEATYSSGCVPNNETSVHCAGTNGDGPAVRGPLRETGWDAFGLDPEGDHQACVDPVGNLDLFGQVLSGIEVAPMAECEGILVSREADGTVSVEELRVGRAPG